MGRKPAREGGGRDLPCRLTEKAEVCGTDGLLTQTEKTVILLYPTEKEIAAGSAVRIRQENGAERQLHCGRREPYFSDAQGGWTEKG